MRIAITATVAAALALLAASMLGVASAEAPSSTTTTTASTPAPVPASTPLRTVSVQGVAEVSIAQGANAASADAVYRQGMAAAVSDGQNKAEFLAAKIGATLASVQSVTEDGGYVQCKGEESNFAEYEGEQPDFGSPGPTVVPQTAAAVAPRAGPSHGTAVGKRRKTKRPTAKKAAASTCTLSAQLSLVYALD